MRRDAAQAAAWWHKAAEQGDTEAQYCLGRAYMDGRGVPEDHDQGLLWYRKAAEQGDVYAQFELGNAYRWEDHRLAMQWYRKAAEQGYPTAQSNLGWGYTNGKGVPRDDAQAAAWYRRAAEQGHGDAQLRLGRQYEIGLGVPRDYVEAHKWLTLAALHRSSAIDHEREASANTLAVTEWMSPSEIAEAQKRAKEWTEAFVLSKPRWILQTRDARQICEIRTYAAPQHAGQFGSGRAAKLGRGPSPIARGTSVLSAAIQHGAPMKP